MRPPSEGLFLRPLADTGSTSKVAVGPRFRTEPDTLDGHDMSGLRVCCLVDLKSLSFEKGPMSDVAGLGKFGHAC
jgi:hypothetical protein